MDQNSPEFRIRAEMQRLRREILECSHCQACREQMARLSMLMPPPPMPSKDGIHYWIYNPPPEEKEMVERMLREMGI